MNNMAEVLARPRSVGGVSSNLWSGGKAAGAVVVSENQPSNHPFFVTKRW